MAAHKQCPQGDASAAAGEHSDVEHRPLARTISTPAATNIRHPNLTRPPATLPHIQSFTADLPSPSPARDAGICRTRSDNIGALMLLKDSCPPYSYMSVIGRRTEMEDTVAAVPSFYSDPPRPAAGDAPMGRLPAFHFFGVYDGHGGAQASGFCRTRLHELLAEELKKAVAKGSVNGWREPAEWDSALKACFRRVDIEVGGLCPAGVCGEGEECKHCGSVVAPENVGTTAVIAVVTPLQIVVANCGDSRAVLCRGGRAVPFSCDHKPQRDDELARIEAAGGRVIDWNGPRVGGFLAMSRAIGDRFLKRYVTSEPEVQCEDRRDDDECLILASDGLWDVVSNQRACDVAKKCLAGYRPHRSTQGSAVAVAAALLTKVALARGSHDNISVVVVDLNPGAAPL